MPTPNFTGRAVRFDISPGTCCLPPSLIARSLRLLLKPDGLVLLTRGRGGTRLLFGEVWELPFGGEAICLGSKVSGALIYALPGEWRIHPALFFFAFLPLALP